MRNHSNNQKDSHAFTAYWDDFNMITVMVEASLNDHLAFTLTDGHLDITIEVIGDFKLGKKRVVSLETDRDYQPGTEYFLRHSSGEQTLVLTGKVVRTPAFDNQFYYEGKLGSFLTEKGTEFKLWAPTASNVVVNIYNDAFQKEKELPMVRQNKGLWKCNTIEFGEGTLYTYSVKVNGSTKEVVDPYVKAATANCKFGMVANLQKTNPANWNPTNKPTHAKPSDAVIYELHVRDFSIQSKSGLKYKGKYKAFSEDLPDQDGIPQGLNYIKWLGATHLELLPIQDFGSVNENKAGQQYNWGYDPIHYFVPEGSYSTDPHNPYTRIREVKEMISSIHSKGLRVIMDVVYNHLYHLEGSNLEKIVPGYYFRYDHGGKPSNGTGVGNDTASERKMMRKLIIDSVTYWVKEFGVDGFRFDLMGIHDIDTMKEVRYAIDCIDPTILVFGEGWHLNTILPDHQKASISHARELPRVGFFNDRFRDSIKGKLFDSHSSGFATGNFSVKEEVKKCIMGSVDDYFIMGSQSINYVECHDNHTLWDRLSRSHPHESEQNKQKMHRLATAITLLSQGIPFIHAGQEFFRTKNGVENSYKSPDRINKFDWRRMRAVQENVAYVKGLIEVRKYFSCFRMSEVHDMHSIHFHDSPDSSIVYSIPQEQSNEKIVVIHNASHHSEWIYIGEGEKWVLVDGTQAGIDPLNKTHDSSLFVGPLNTVVFIKIE